MIVNTLKQVAAVTLFLAFTSVSLQAPDVNLQPGESVSITCAQAINVTTINPNSVLVACANVPTLTPTASPVPSFTASPVPSHTASASPTRTPTQTPTLPAPSATLTPSAMPTMPGHDTSKWHSITGNDHEHGDNPNAPEIVAMFGPAGALWNSGSDRNIGVPFETSPIENTMKHAMAKYYTMTAAQLNAAGYPCGVENDTDNGGVGTANCIRGWRILAHGGGNLMEAQANNHSAFIELKVCKLSDQTQCGTISGGGWIFYGKLQSPFYNQAFERSGGVHDIGGMTMTFKSDAQDLTAIQSPYNVFQDWGGEPYWFMFRNDPGDVAFYNSNSTSLAGDQISSNEVGPSNLFDCAPFPVGALCGNRLFHIAIRYFDGWNLLDVNDIYNPIFICSQISPSNCRFNNTLRGAKEVQAWVDPAWDGAPFDTDARPGYVSMVRYTDVYQRLSGSCTSQSAVCVPLVLQNMPVGYASVKLNISTVEPGVDREYDCPGGGCVKFPN